MAISLPHTLAEIPGDPGGIRSKASRFTATAEAIQSAVRGLRESIADTSDHESEALDALANDADTVATSLDTLHNRYSVAGTALTVFAGALETAQSEARSLVTSNGSTIADENYVRGRINHYTDLRRSTTDPTVAADLNQQLILLNRRMNGIQGDLNAQRERFTSIITTLRAAGTSAATQLTDAMKSDKIKDSLWDNISGWVHEHAELLKAIHDIMGVIAAGLAILSFFIPVLAPFALAAAAVTAGLGLLLAATGEISWVDFGLDLLGLVTGGVATIATRSVKGITAALKSTRVANLASLGKGGSALRSVTGSFNGLLKGTKGLKVAGVQLPSVTWIKEVMSSKGVWNAHFLRIAERGRAGAGGPFDEMLLNIGRHNILTAKLALGINTAAQQGNSAMTSYLPTALDMLPDSLTDNAITDFLGSVTDSYAGFREDATWKIGS